MDRDVLDEAISIFASAHMAKGKKGPYLDFPDGSEYFRHIINCSFCLAKISEHLSCDSARKLLDQCYDVPNVPNVPIL